MIKPVQQRLRLQFSMRLVLLVMAILAGALGIAVYVRQPGNRKITIEQASRIKPGMSEREVIAVLGAPFHRFEGASSLRWVLENGPVQGIAYRDISFLDIAFDGSGKVVKIDEVGSSRPRTIRSIPAESTQEQPVK
jgi:hypothetical protein